MFMPDEALAKQAVTFLDKGRLLLFEVYDYVRFPEGTAHDRVVSDLTIEGRDRNVFFVSQSGVPVWRVARYHERKIDSFVFISKLYDGEYIPKSDDGDEKYYAFGISASGDMFKISLGDGSLIWVGWSK